MVRIHSTYNNENPSALIIACILTSGSCTCAPQHSTATLQPTATQQQAQNEQSKLSPLSAKVLIKHHHLLCSTLCTCWLLLRRTFQPGRKFGIERRRGLQTEPVRINKPLPCYRALVFLPSVPWHHNQRRYSLHNTSPAQHQHCRRRRICCHQRRHQRRHPPHRHRRHQRRHQRRR